MSALLQTRRWVDHLVRRLQRREEGVTLLEVVIALGIGAMLSSVLTSAVLVIMWLPGERSDRVTVAQDVQNAEHWITRDVNSASSFVAGASPTYGVFSWSDYTGDTQLNYAATYSYDAANGYLMRTEQQNGVTASTLAVAKNIAGGNDVVFTWNAGTYSVQVSLTSTVMTGTSKEGITTTIRSGLGTMAARPRNEISVSPPSDVGIPPPPAGSVSYYVAGNPVLTAGSYVSGGAAELLSSDSAYYVADSSSGNPKQIVYTVQSQSMTQPASISQIEVRFIGMSDNQNVSLDLYVKGPTGYPASPDSSFTFTTPDVSKTAYFYLDADELSYINSLPDRRVDLKVSASGNVNYQLSSNQILFTASP